MFFCHRKTCKVLFTVACVIVVAFMVGYWFYKFKVEDRDIGVVDYVPLKDAKEIKFPLVSWCLKDPFIEEKLKAKNSSITSTAYRQYLEGKIHDKSYEQIDYPNVTIDLNQYLLAGNVWFKNGTERNITLDNINFIETFSGFHMNDFFKCYTMKFVVDEQRNLKKVGALLNRTRLISDWQGKSPVALYVVHYPGQFFLLKQIEIIHIIHLRWYGVTQLRMIKVEILKQRNSRNRKCSYDVGNYDDTIVDKILQKTGCRPPYLYSHKSYPQCEIQKDIRESRIDTLAREQIEIPTACERLSEVRKTLGRGGNYLGNWVLTIKYPEEVKIITQSQDVDVHALIGNIGGYLGLFLGKLI